MPTIVLDILRFVNKYVENLEIKYIIVINIVYRHIICCLGEILYPPFMCIYSIDLYKPLPVQYLDTISIYLCLFSLF